MLHCVSLSPCFLRAHLNSAENSRALEVQDALERVRIEVSRPGAEVVETPKHRVRHEERVVLEEKVLVLFHAFRSEDPDVAAGNGPQQVRLFAPAIFLLVKTIRRDSACQRISSDKQAVLVVAGHGNHTRQQYMRPVR